MGGHNLVVSVGQVNLGSSCSAVFQRIIFALVVYPVSFSPSIVRPSDVLFMAVNMYLKHLREHSALGKIYNDDCQNNTKRLKYTIL